MCYLGSSKCPGCVVAAKPDNLNSTPGISRRSKRTGVEVAPDLYSLAVVHTCSPSDTHATHTYTITVTVIITNFNLRKESKNASDLSSHLQKLRRAN